jgi:hypothetical protein
MNILDAHLIDYLNMIVHGPRLPSNDLFLFIETVQDKIINMEKSEYMDFLVALKKQIKRQAKKGDCMTVLPACLYVKSFSCGTTIKEIAEQEKWKRGVDDLAKLVFYCGM